MGGVHGRPGVYVREQVKGLFGFSRPSPLLARHICPKCDGQRIVQSQSGLAFKQGRFGDVSFRKFPLLSRGGVAATSSKCRAASPVGADGVVLVKEYDFFTSTTPSARNKDAARYISWPRSHPSSAEEGNLSTMAVCGCKFILDSCACPGGAMRPGCICGFGLGARPGIPLTAFCSDPRKRPYPQPCLATRPSLQRAWQWRGGRALR